MIRHDPVRDTAARPQPDCWREGRHAYRSPSLPTSARKLLVAAVEQDSIRSRQEINSIHAESCCCLNFAFVHQELQATAGCHDAFERRRPFKAPGLVKDVDGCASIIDVPGSPEPLLEKVSESCQQNTLGEIVYCSGSPAACLAVWMASSRSVILPVLS